MQDESFRSFLDMAILDPPRPDRMNTPLLVLGTKDDVMVPPDEIKKAARIYNTEPVFFSGMGHDMMLDQGWQEVADRILNWLEELNLQ